MPIKLNAVNPDEPSAKPIVLDEIKKMTDYYRKGQRPNEAKSAWVSVSELLQLIKDNNANGVRIYYGRHADNDPDEGFKSKHNVILVATRDTVNPDHPTTENSFDQLNEYKEDGKVNSVVVRLPYGVEDEDGEYTGMGDDAIPLCPPRCPTGKPSPLD